MTAYVQSVDFSSAAKVTLRWPDFKSLVITSKALPVQYVEDPGTYTVWGLDGSVVYVTMLVKSSLSSNFPFDQMSPDYSQSQNDTDCAEWEATYKSAANTVLVPHAADNRPAVRMTTANKTKNFNLKVFSFCPGNTSSLANKSATLTDLTDVTMTCYDSGGNTTTDPTQAVKTVLDYEPPFNYEVIGGWIDVPSSIAGGSTDNWWISCIGVPDIPSSLGGSIPFVYGTNLESVYTNKVVSDGRATQYLVYNATYHTNKLRWILAHPTGTNPRFQVYLETFV